jgi:hypothetical protein
LQPSVEFIAGNNLPRNPDKVAMCRYLTHFAEDILTTRALTRNRSSVMLVRRRYRVGMFAGRRFALVGAGAAFAWYVCILIFWALQPLADAVPVGIDYTLKQPTPVSVTVECNRLFDGAARGGALPALTVQPQDKPKLGYQREPCAIVHRQARMVFALDTASILVVVLVCVWLALRWRRPSSPGR